MRETNGVNNHHNRNVHDKSFLAGKGWYFGSISRSQCDQLLNDRGLDGDFLIRDSETNVSYDFVLHFKFHVSLSHFSVMDIQF